MSLADAIGIVATVLLAVSLMAAVLVLPMYTALMGGLAGWAGGAGAVCAWHCGDATEARWTGDACVCFDAREAP